MDNVVFCDTFSFVYYLLDKSSLSDWLICGFVKQGSMDSEFDYANKCSVAFVHKIFVL